MVVRDGAKASRSRGDKPSAVGKCTVYPRVGTPKLRGLPEMVNGPGSEVMLLVPACPSPTPFAIFKIQHRDGAK